MLSLAKQNLPTHLLTESCKVKKILIHEERTYSRLGSNIFSTFNLSLPNMSLEMSLLEVNSSKLCFLEILLLCLLFVASLRRFYHTVRLKFS